MCPQRGRPQHLWLRRARRCAVRPVSGPVQPSRVEPSGGQAPSPWLEPSPGGSLVRMPLRRARLCMISLCAMLLACQATVGTGTGVDVPADSADQCATYCERIGMELGAVAIMADNVGCICSPRSENEDEAANVSAATIGMATIALREMAEQDRDDASTSWNRPFVFGYPY